MKPALLLLLISGSGVFGSACCINPTVEVDNSTSSGLGTSGSTSSSGSTSGSTSGACPQFWDGGCGNPEVCSTQVDYECVTVPGTGSSCLGVTGAICQSDCDCANGNCEPPLRSDCLPPEGCPGDAGPSLCRASANTGPCVSDSDCSNGVCQHLDAGIDYSHLLGTCCAQEGYPNCTTDADCCAGLTCATDNTGCRVGPTPVCVIDGVTYASGAANPASPKCQSCDPYTSPSAWTNAASNQICFEDGGYDGTYFYCCDGICTDSCGGAPSQSGT